MPKYALRRENLTLISLQKRGKHEPCPIKVENLTKIYGRPGTGVTAVDHISFEVNQGEIFGFLGPNGAGKTPGLTWLCF